MNNIILEALNGHLATKPGNPPIAWPNQSFNVATVTGDSYYRVALLPGIPEQIELGDTASNRLSGIYQVSVYWRAGKSGVKPSQEADIIIARFKRGTALIAGALIVKVNAPPYQSPAQQEPDWYFIPVSIPYICDAPN